MLVGVRSCDDLQTLSACAAIEQGDLLTPEQPLSVSACRVCLQSLVHVGLCDRFLTGWCKAGRRVVGIQREP